MYISSRSAKACEETANELNSQAEASTSSKVVKGRCISVAADMQKLEDVQRLVDEIKKDAKVLHVLVNNAGAAWGEDIEEYSVRAFIEPCLVYCGPVFSDAMNGQKIGCFVHQSSHIESSARVYPHASMSSFATRSCIAGRERCTDMERSREDHQCLFSSHSPCKCH